MKNLNALALALICAVPVVASAQTPSGMDKAPPSVKPTNTPTSEMDRKTTGTDSSATGTGTTAGSAMSHDSTDHANMKNKKMKKGEKGDTATQMQPPAGDVPTYPAKTKDGRATSPAGDTTTTK